MNDKEIELLWKQLLNQIGENTEREGLVDTPKRITRMYKELFKGYGEPPNVTVFNNGEDGVCYDEMIIDEGTFYSHCEHHVVPFFGKYYFAYIPSSKGKILGLSKVARVVDHFSAKLQVQERLTYDIVNYLWKSLCYDCTPPLGMALVMKAEHLCKTMRGVKKKGQMTSSVMKGVFKSNSSARHEFLNLI